MAWTQNWYLLVFLVYCESLRIRKPTKPEIWLASFSEVDSFEQVPAPVEFRTRPIYDNGFVYKNGTNYVIQDDTARIYLACRSTFPVVWNIPVLSQVERVPFYRFSSTGFRKSSFPKRKSKPKNKYFETVISIGLPINHFLSVNLTCEASHLEKHYTSSVHVFYAGPRLIEKVGETIQVSLLENQIIFPCRPATPNVTVLLEERAWGANNTETWIRVNPLPGWARFDPKLGFVLSNYVGNIVGYFRCIAFDKSVQVDEYLDGEFPSESQMVYLNVTENGNRTIDEKQFEVIHEFNGNASVFYNDHHFGSSISRNISGISTIDTELTCCTGISEEKPEVSAESCDNLLQCQLLKAQIARFKRQGLYGGVFDYNEFEPKDCMHVYIDYPGTVVTCHSKNVKFVEFFTKVFPAGIMPLLNRSNIRNHLDGIFSLDHEVETEENERNIPIHQKVFLTVGFPVPDAHYSKYYQHYWFLGTTFSLVKDRLIYSDFGDDGLGYYFPEQRYGRSLRNKRRLRSNKIAEYAREVYYELEPLVSICLAWKLRHAEGAHLTILWENGTRTVVEERGENELHLKTVYFAGGLYTAHPDATEFVFRFGRPVIAEKNMAALECWMPQVDTEEWDVMRKNLTILDSTPPSFKGSKEMNVVYVYLEEGYGIAIELEFKIKSGSPKPRISVTKDGKDVFFGDPNQEFNHRSYVFENLVNVTMTGVGDDENTTKSEILTVKLTIANFTQEMQGDYLCIAENVRGTAKQVLKVVIAEKRHVMYPIFLTILLLLGLICAGLVGWHCRQRIQLRALSQRISTLIYI